MAIFLLAWACRRPEPLPEVAFEYVIHPHSGDGGVNYFNGLIEAADKKAAWKAIQSAFPGAARNLNEPATPEFVKKYEGIRKTPGIQIVKPRTPPA